MTQPLAGLRVIELAEGIAGPYAGKLLADYGADVIKIESGDGDRSRRLGPFPETGFDPEQSALFLHLNTNKRSVRAELDSDLLADLIGSADIVLQSAPVPPPEELRKKQPGLVIVTITAFGLTGPYSGYVGEEIVHYAFGGPMSATGDPTREPVKMGGDLGQYQCGTVAAVSALAAVTGAGVTGDGAHIDLSNVETQVGSIDRRMTYLLYAAYRGADVPRSGGYRVSAFPNGCRPSGDGHVQMSTLMNWVPRMLSVVQNPELTALFEDPDWILNEDLPDLADAHLLAWSTSRSGQEAMEEGQAQSWPVTAVNRPIDLLSDPHFAERGFFTPVDHPVAGSVRQPGAPIRMDGGWAIRRPAPLLGEHTDEVAAGLSPSARPELVTAAASEAKLPLDGIRVLDMSVVWAGPYATMLLGDLGADIIRVDNPWVFPSATRGLMPRPPKEMITDIGGIFGGYPDGEPGERPWNRVALFTAHARNKRSVTLDLRKDLGRETFLQLVDECDVLIENNSVDLLDKLGVGWETLHARNPKLIAVRMPSVGLEGPYRSYLGFGVNFEALCGLMSIRGYLDADLSENDSVFHMDAASGSAGAFAALTALRRRASTGVGELIELSQSENMLNHIGEFLIDAERTGAVHGSLGNRHWVHAPQGVYRCSGGDDQWVALSVNSDEVWSSLIEVMGSPDWATDERYSSVAGRHEHHDELDDRLGEWTAAQAPDAVFHACQAAGVPAAPVLHETEAMIDPHLRARGMFRDNGSEELGVHEYPTHVWRWDGPDLAWGPVPTLGQDNEAVFKELLGLTDGEYERLVADGHISQDYLGLDGEPL